MERARQVIHELSAPTHELRGHIPETWEAFAALHRAAMADGALRTSTKELIALGIAIVERCDGCIAQHTGALARLGVSDDEVAEAIGVAVLMGGGPATVYGPRAWEMFRERRAPRTSTATEGS